MCLLPTWYIDISKASVATIPRLIQNLSDTPGQLRFLSKVVHLSREKFYGQFPGNVWFSVEVTVQRDSMSKCTTDIFAQSAIIYGRIDNIDKATFLLDVSLSFELKHTRRVVHKDIPTLTITNFYEHVYRTFYRKRFEISLTLWTPNCGTTNFVCGKCQFFVGFCGKLWAANIILWTGEFRLWEVSISCGLMWEIVGNEHRFASCRISFVGSVNFLWVLWEICGKWISFCG